MNRFIIPLAVFAVLVVVFGISLKNAPERQEKQESSSALIDRPAPEFSLPNLLEPAATVNSAAFKGRWYLVNVWGTWCEGCRAEHQTLLDIKQQGKVIIVGLNYKDEDETARQWLAELGNPYEVVAVDREGRAAIDFGVYGAPENYLVNPAGVIVAKAWGLTPEKWRTTMLPLIEGTTK
jgi:cytochrome c biogenesis protein CcmG/thiol:disulfide interchange protein DsbE